MSLADAMADLAAATSNTDHLGRAVVIDGTEVVCVKRSLTVEESATFADGLGQAVEGLRLTVDLGELGYEPHYNQDMVVDSKRYTIKNIAKTGSMRRLTMTRYTG